jgi:hypothetical protein
MEEGRGQLLAVIGKAKGYPVKLTVSVPSLSFPEHVMLSPNEVEATLALPQGK